MTQVIKGLHSLAKVEGVLKEYSPKSILLVTGTASYEKSGAREVLGGILSPYSVTHLSGFAKLPTPKGILRVIAAFNECSPDLVIVLGGGAVLDIAKSAFVLVPEIKKDSSVNIEAFLMGKREVSTSNKVKKFFVPTTAGTGAEITPFAVAYVNGIKHSFVHESMLPDFVVLDGSLTASLPLKVAASTACDALAQSIESFWSVKATEESKSFSRQALERVLPNISQVAKEPNAIARQALLEGAHLSGKAIALAKTTAAHALSYPLTAHHGIAHGHAVMLTLPYFCEFNAAVTEENIQEGCSVEGVKETMSDFFSLLGVSSGSEAKEKLLAIVRSLGLEQKLSRLGVGHSDLDRLLVEGFNPARVRNNPVVLTKEKAHEILESIV